MSKTHLLTVSDTFTIEKRGVIIVGNCLVEGATLNRDQEITICTPSGDEIKTKIIGVDYFTKCFSENQAVGLLVDINEKSEVPLESRVFI